MGEGQQDREVAAHCAQAREGSRPAPLRKPAACFPQPAQLMPKQNTRPLPAAGGQRAKTSVPRAGRCPGILPLLPGHPPFPCLWHIHTHVPRPGHHPQPTLWAQGVGGAPPGPAPHTSKPCPSSQSSLCPGGDLILARLLWAEHVAPDGWELLRVAMGGNSLAREGSSSQKEAGGEFP